VTSFTMSYEHVYVWRI